MGRSCFMGEGSSHRSQKLPRAHRRRPSSVSRVHGQCCREKSKKRETRTNDPQVVCPSGDSGRTNFLTAELTAMNKEAKTKYPVLDLIKKRWSARAFSKQNIEDHDLFTLFEAAHWAASSTNEQPWRYIYAKREDKEVFNKMLNCLMPNNQPWAKNAAVLILCLMKTVCGPNNEQNTVAQHDL